MHIYLSWTSALLCHEMNNVYFSKEVKIWSNKNEIIDLHGSVELLITADINVMVYFCSNLRLLWICCPVMYFGFHT